MMHLLREEGISSLQATFLVTKHTSTTIRRSVAFSLQQGSPHALCELLVLSRADSSKALRKILGACLFVFCGLQRHRGEISGQYLHTTSPNIGEKGKNLFLDKVWIQKPMPARLLQKLPVVCKPPPPTPTPSCCKSMAPLTSVGLFISSGCVLPGSLFFFAYSATEKLCMELTQSALHPIISSLPLFTKEILTLSCLLAVALSSLFLLLSRSFHGRSVPLHPFIWTHLVNFICCLFLAEV